MSKMIMDFHVKLYGDQVTEMICDTGSVKILPFTGSVESELFCGKVLPGACDVQVTNASGIRQMCAKYMFEGKDSTGASCKLFVENNGYFEPERNPKPFHACPTFMTDSKTLAPYLQQARFRAEGQSDEECLHIRIFDVLADN